MSAEKDELPREASGKTKRTAPRRAFADNFSRASAAVEYKDGVRVRWGDGEKGWVDRMCS